jgi:signal transduction histidine kinase/ABC-type phosphate/phosphonate transport system substrate-binding protein
MRIRPEKRSGLVPIRRLILAVFVLEIFCVSSTHAQEQAKSAKIGVLTHHGPEQCFAKWSATAEYLTDSVAGWTFSIVPLMPDELYTSVRDGRVDFILATSSLYVELEVFYGASRIATLRNVYPEGTYTYFGGVLFCRSDRSDIRELDDLKGKMLMGLHERACTAWHAVWLEMLENGIDPFKDLTNIEFGGSHKAIVEAVRTGSVDVGAVRSDTFERMRFSGKIKPDEFRVIHERNQEHKDVPFSHSTRVFSEKPMAKLSHTPNELAEKVSAALIEMSPESPAAKAAECGGWTIPHNYQSVHDCLKTLRVSPYEDYGKITLAGVFRQYGPWIITIIVLIVLVVGSVMFILLLKNRLSSAQKVILEHQITEISDRAHRKFSQNLHDSLGQQLTGIRFMAEILKDKLQTDSSGYSDSAQKISDLVHKAMNQSRDLAKGLDPVELSENNLVSAIEVLLRNIENTFDVSCEFEHDESIAPAHNSHSVHLYRITQEAINNALRHGKAKHIRIGLRELDGKYVLSVADDGVGFSEEQEGKKGMGLHIMRYRAKAVNGVLDIKSGQNGGVVVKCSLPKTA